MQYIAQSLNIFITSCEFIFFNKSLFHGVTLPQSRSSHQQKGNFPMTVKEFNQSVELHSDAVYRFVLKNIKDEEKARDIVQDSFEKLWRNHENVNGEKVKSYLFSTAYHTLIDMVRRDSKKGDWNHVNQNQLSYEGSYSDVNEILHQALEQLPESQKMVLMLRDYEGYSYQEISELTHLSEAQVKVYIFRARVFLKNYIGKIEALV